MMLRPGEDPRRILVDRRRDDHHRHLPHHLGRRRVLDQLEDLGSVHDRPGRRRQVLAEDEARGIHAGRQPRRARQVPQQVPRSLDQVGATVVDRRLQRGRVRPQEVRWRQRVGDVLDHEQQLPLGGPVELGIVDQIVSRGASREVGLRDAPEQPAVLPGRIGEAPVLRTRRSRRRARDRRRELYGKASQPARHPARPPRQAEGSPGGGARGKEARADRGVGDQDVPALPESRRGPRRFGLRHRRRGRPEPRLRVGVAPGSRRASHPVLTLG